MAYDTFLENLAQRIKSRLGQIEAPYTFDNGTEFEVALCELFRQFLPSKYGVCRGFAVAADSQKAGDDIIIFDRERFPTLRLLEHGQFGIKEQIPFEAIYAYIEVKNTLYLEPDGKRDGQTIDKAVSQTMNFHALQRDPVPLSTFAPGVELQDGFELKTPEGWPSCRNPLFCAIIARNFACKMGEKQTDPDLIPLAREKINKLRETNSALPDLIVAGENHVFLPVRNRQHQSPFFLPNESHLVIQEVQGHALAIGLLVISRALDSILLGQLKWPHLFSDALNVPVREI